MAINESPELTALRSATNAEIARRAEFELLDGDLVAAARASGSSWEAIARVKGITRKGAEKRYVAASREKNEVVDLNLPGVSVADYAKANGMNVRSVNNRINAGVINAIQIPSVDRARLIWRITE